MAEPVLENNEIKQRAIRRLIVAVALVLVAVGILTYLSFYKPAKVVTKPAVATLPPPPPPIVTGPEPQALEPAQAAQLLPEPPIDIPAPPAATQAAPAPALAPPPPTVSTKPLLAPGPGPNKPSAEQQKAILKAEPAKPAPPAAPLATAAPTTAPQAASTVPTSKPSPSSFVVQFGLFSNPQNALQLVERLKQLGIESKTETRVQLPTFKTKVEAEAALAKMKEKGINATLVTR